MSAGWAVSLPLENALAAGPLRQAAGVEACVAGDRLWLRGADWSESLDRSLRKVLGAERFHRFPGDETARWGCILPSGMLPDGPWSPLKEWLQPVAPRTVLPAKVGQRAAVRLVRTVADRPANLLAVDYQAWHEYAVTAPQIRLNRLSFAVSNDGQALIRGEPLPPLAGERYAEANGIAMPLGWTWSPAVDAAVIREALGLAEHDLALITLAGAYEVVRGDDFVRATRSAVRLTEKEIHGG